MIECVLLHTHTHTHTHTHKPECVLIHTHTHTHTLTHTLSHTHLLVAIETREEVIRREHILS